MTTPCHVTHSMRRSRTLSIVATLIAACLIGFTAPGQVNSDVLKIDTFTTGFNPFAFHTNDFAGRGMAADDNNGDGRSEVIAGSVGLDFVGSNTGGVYLFSRTPGHTALDAWGRITTLTGYNPLGTGAIGGINLTAFPLNAGDAFGDDVAVLGDYDGDGINDLIVGATGDDDGGLNTGALYILYMNDDLTFRDIDKISNSFGGLSAHVTIPSNTFFGVSISAGDLDGDGIVDLAVGAHVDSGTGTAQGALYRVYLNPYGSSTLVKSADKISSANPNGAFTAGLVSDWDLFGIATAIVDVNGDNKNDIVVGAIGDDDSVGPGTPAGAIVPEFSSPSFDSPGAKNTGAVYVLFQGSSNAISSVTKIGGLSFSAIGDHDLFGHSLASTHGDVDNDGVNDLLVGAATDDGGKGAAFLLFLNSDGTVKGYRHFLSGTTDFPSPLAFGDNFGAAIAVANDGLIADGGPCLFVGARGDDTGGSGNSRRGAAYAVCPVYDYLPPSINCPIDVTVECDEGTSPAVTGAATASAAASVCEPIVSITSSDVSIVDPSCPNALTITRTWTATDSCGNVNTCEQTIRVQDTVAPTFVSVPADVTLEIGDSTDPSNTGGLAVATDGGCTGAGAIVTFTDVTVVSTLCKVVIERQFVAVDACGNSTAPELKIQTITLLDTTPPLLTVPADVEIDCRESTDPSNTGVATAVDSNTAVTIVYSDDSVRVGDTICITRTWKAHDECGNSAVGVQKIVRVNCR